MPNIRWYLGNIIASLLLAGPVLLSGCYRTWVSQGHIAPTAHWQAKSAGSGTFLVGPDIQLFVKINNETPPLFTNPQPHPLQLSLTFYSIGSGFKFDPSAVTILFSDSNEIKPSSIVIQSWGQDPRIADWSCGGYTIVKPAAAPPYGVKRGLCFELSFNIRAPISDVPFAMHIEGLRRNEEKIIVPEVQFQKGSFKVLALPLFP